MAAGLSTIGTLRFDVVESPLGDVLIAANDAGVMRISIGSLDVDATLEELEARTPNPLQRDPRGMRTATREIAEYFGRKRRRFDVAVDLSEVRGFSRDVLHATGSIPFGSVATYGDVAAGAGRPRAARAAGNALRGNPVPILVPCHRVVPSSGGIGGYGGQEAHKAFLLDLESRG